MNVLEMYSNMFHKDLCNGLLLLSNTSVIQYSISERGTVYITVNFKDLFESALNFMFCRNTQTHI